METSFKDHFSENSQEYKQFRPKYPAELFSYLASISSSSNSSLEKKAWDCATGTGQAACGLADYFSEVIATDASKDQIENAVKKKGVSYQVASAENNGIESNSIDLITVAQAFHWFDIDAFILEVNRVLKGRGILAVWTYNLLSVQGTKGKTIDDVINHFYGSVLEDFWPDERALVESGYKDIHLPFKELKTPVFHMSTEWSLPQITGYLNTWSAVKKFQNKMRVNPVERLYDEISGMWGEPEKTRLITWPLNIRVWQK